MDLMISNEALESAVIITETDSFLKIYGNALRNIRDRQPDEWLKQLEVTKTSAIRSGTAQAVVEMLALSKIEYEGKLMEGTASDLVESLHSYAKSNNIKLGE